MLIEQLAPEFTAALSVAKREWPVEFLPGQNIAVLESDLDTRVLEDTTTVKRINAWAFADAGFEQNAPSNDPTRSITRPQGRNIVSRRLRMWYAYEFYPGAMIQASANVEAVRKKLNTLPKMGFQVADLNNSTWRHRAQWVVGHDKLQCPDISPQPFHVTVIIAQCSLVYHTIEALGT